MQRINQVKKHTTLPLERVKSTSMETSRVYDERYRGDYRASLSGFEVARWKALDQFANHFLDVNSVKTIVDYGSGSGLHVELWEKVFPNSSLHFCDISQVALEKLAKRFSKYNRNIYLITNDEAPLQNGMADLVVSVEVLEHVKSVQSYLRDIHRVLKPGGHFIWTTPCSNPFSVEHVFSLLTGKIQATGEGFRRWSWEDPTHLRRLRSGEARVLLENAGFSKVQFQFRSHLFSFLCTYTLGRIGALQALSERLMTLDYLLFRNLPNGASMLGIARKV